MHNTETNPPTRLPGRQDPNFRRPAEPGRGPRADESGHGLRHDFLVLNPRPDLTSEVFTWLSASSVRPV